MTTGAQLKQVLASLKSSQLTLAHMTVTLVVAGAVLGALGLYEPLIKFAGAGASVPISSFANALVKGAISEAERTGLVEVLFLPASLK